MSLAGTKLSKIKNLITQIEKISDTEDPAVSFEFLIGSLYPEVYSNVQEAIRCARIQGYIDGSLGDDWENTQKDIKIDILCNEIENLGELVDNVWEKAVEMAASIDDEKQRLVPTPTDKDELFINLVLPRVVSIKKICDASILKLHLNEGAENGD